MQELSQGHDLSSLIEKIFQNHERLDQKHQALMDSLSLEREKIQHNVQEMLDLHQQKCSEERQEWSEKSKNELVKFQRDSDELYQRCSESFDEIHDDMESAQEKLKERQVSLDEMNAQLTISIDKNLERESVLQERLMKILETRLKDSLEQFELMKVAISRLTDLKIDLKGQIKSHSAAIKGLEEYRELLISRRVVESHEELLDQLKTQNDEVKRVDSTRDDLIEQIDALQRALSEEQRKQNMNVIIAALVGVVGWFF